VTDIGHVHDFSEEVEYHGRNGERLLVSKCPCGMGSLRLGDAPNMTIHWLLEHLEGVETWVSGRTVPELSIEDWCDLHTGT